MYRACSGEWWADPGGTAIPGQPAMKAGASSKSLSPNKNEFNIEGDTWSPYQILS